MKNFSIFITVLLLSQMIFAQKPVDKAVFESSKPGYYQNVVLKEIADFTKMKTVSKQQRKIFTMDFTGKSYPVNPEKYNRLWHNEPLSQGRTGTCWCFSSTSFIESEVYRQTGQKVKLSEMFVVYYEYVERAKYFVENRGNMNFGEGSEVNAVPKIIKHYGIVPYTVYTGKLKGQKMYDHKAMVSEMTVYLNKVKENNLWDKQQVVNTIKSIMDYYMGKPPEEFEYKGKNITPVYYAKEIIKINPDDYYCFMSTTEKRYGEKGELQVPDNWWHSDDYYNVGLDDFAGVFINALKKGFTAAFCGDVSEPGYNKYQEVGVIPTFDIPPEYIDANARELRFRNGSTTDDHCMHVVGYLEKDGKYWFMIKDSSASGFDGEHKGYIFINEDYLKLKILAVMVHKDGARQVLDKIIK